MRAALFMVGMLVNSGLQTLAQSNGMDIEYSDSVTYFVAMVFLIFSAMDVTDFIVRLRKLQKGSE